MAKMEEEDTDIRVGAIDVALVLSSSPCFEMWDGILVR